MSEAFFVALSDLPEYGLRYRSGKASAVHRIADDRPIPACAREANGGATSTNPGKYKRVRLSLAAETRRFSLCSHGHCFGRLQIADALEATSERMSTQANRNVA